MTIWLTYSAAELSALIRQRQLSPVQLVQSTLARIERSQPVLNAFITVCAEDALSAAREAEQALKRSDTLPPLLGVPFSVKDLVSTVGVRTTFGSRIFEHHVPTVDAVAVARLKAAGAILIGKTTTPEFGQKGLTEAPLFGHTRNPWRADRTPGGSSGGAAVAVAAGLGPIGVATDGGGSTRIPAACNGVVGFKQSLGVVPVDSAQDAFGNISYVTPMTRTVMDTALMLDVMAGPHPSDPHSLNRTRQHYVEAARAQGDLNALKIAWRPFLGNKVVAAEVLDLCAAAVGVLSELGAAVFEMPDDFENPEPLWLTVNGSYRMAQFGHHLKDHRARMDPTLVAQLERASRYSAAGAVPGDLPAHADVSAGPGLVRARRRHRHPNLVPHGPADRPGFFRPDRDRRQADRHDAAGLVPLHSSIQHDREPCYQHPLRLGQPRPASRAAAHWTAGG